MITITNTATISTWWESTSKNWRTFQILRKLRPLLTLPS